MLNIRFSGDSFAATFAMANPPFKPGDRIAGRIEPVGGTILSLATV